MCQRKAVAMVTGCIFKVRQPGLISNIAPSQKSTVKALLQKKQRKERKIKLKKATSKSNQTKPQKTPTTISSLWFSSE